MNIRQELKDWHYTPLFNEYDTDGEEQISTEEAIAGNLFFNYEERTILEHTCDVIELVSQHFQIESFPIEDILKLVQQVRKYLSTWKISLESSYGPNDGEASDAGKELLLLILSVLWPDFVTTSEEEDEA